MERLQITSGETHGEGVRPGTPAYLEVMANHRKMVANYFSLPSSKRKNTN